MSLGGEGVEFGGSGVGEVDDCGEFCPGLLALEWEDLRVGIGSGLLPLPLTPLLRTDYRTALGRHWRPCSFGPISQRERE